MARPAPLIAALLTALGTLYLGCTQDFGAFEPQPGAGGGTATSSSTNGAAGGAQCSDDAQCLDNDPCTNEGCIQGECFTEPIPDGPVPFVTDLPGDCVDERCVAGQSTQVDDDSETPEDGNDCTVDTCQGGDPQSANAPAGTPCMAGVCNATGQCTGCLDPTDCAGTDDFCKTRTCVAEVCGFDYTPAGTALPGADQTDGDCQLLRCDGSGGVQSDDDDGDPPLDGNPCTQGDCTNGVPENPNAPVGTACGGGDVCNDMAQCVECVSDAQCTAPETCGALDPFLCGCDEDPMGTTCNGHCGSVTGNCGQVEACGGCPGSQVCFQTVCCSPQSMATTCSGKCGMVTDNCGQTIACGGCVAPQTCGGGGTANVCGCTPDNVAACAGKNCGSVVNNCGQVVTCQPNSCMGTGVTCGGGGTPNVCGCTPNNAAACAGKNCGTVQNNCGQTITCQPNMCVLPQVCTANVCT